MLEHLPQYLAIGAFAGFFAGLLGIGGGSIITPLLILLFDAQGISGGLSVRLAIGTSLGVIIFTAVPSFTTHARRGAVDWKIARAAMIFALIAGAFVGPGVVSLLEQAAAALGGGDIKAAQTLIGGMLALALALFLGGESARLLGFIKPPTAAANPPPNAPPPRARVGFFIGAASAMVGIGGGVVMGPYLARSGVPLPRAIGTAAFFSFPLAIFGAASQSLSGLNAESLPAGALGYVYWAIIPAIAAAGMISAVVGARLTHKLPVKTLRRVFGVLLLLIALRLLARLFV
jgi:uncharacterized membrane protein YfcA